VVSEREPQSYTHRLLNDENLQVKKLGEEFAEALAACIQRRTLGMKEEAADLLFHLAVALRARGVHLHEVLEVLRKRRYSPQHHKNLESIRDDYSKGNYSKEGG